jgi:hypothetical protein
MTQSIPHNVSDLLIQEVKKSVLKETNRIVERISMVPGHNPMVTILTKSNVMGAQDQRLFYIRDHDPDDTAINSLFGFFALLPPELKVDHARLVRLQLIDGDNGTPAQRGDWNSCSENCFRRKTPWKRYSGRSA